MGSNMIINITSYDLYCACHVTGVAGHMHHLL